MGRLRPANDMVECEEAHGREGSAFEVPSFGNLDVHAWGVRVPARLGVNGAHELSCVAKACKR